MRFLIAAGCPDPDCDAPASGEDMPSLWSTHGPVRHIRTTCVAGHHFQGPADTLLKGEDSEEYRAA